jgi:hypothetical protein
MENPDRDSEPEDNADDFDGIDEEELRSAYENASYAFEEETGYEAPDFDTFRKITGVAKGDKADQGKSRVKSLYRRIARLLHPDCSDSFSLREQRLWIRAQEAYKNGDAAALETVLSHIEAAASGPLFGSCVSELLENTREMWTRINLLEQDLHDVRQHPAWRFTQKTPTQLVSLKKKVEKAINESLKQARSELASIEMELQELELAHARMAARRAKSRKRREPSKAAQQSSFSF